MKTSNLRTMKTLIEVINFTNENSGFTSVVLFFFTVLIAWFSGVFKYFNNNPIFKIETLKQCTFGSSIEMKSLYKTAFVTYLQITNVGKAPSSIKEINLGYLKSGKLNYLEFLLLKSRFRKYLHKITWIDNIICKEKFSIILPCNNYAITYPFLIQSNINHPLDNYKYLEVGKITSGIVYFEQENFENSQIPISVDKKFTIYIRIKDSFKNIFIERFEIDMIDYKEAIKYNSKFAQTLTNF